jgi:hypothetical protein
MSTATLSDPAIRDFASAVRSALSDLPADEVDELTDGLEADLEEQAMESDNFVLSDPVAYAHELRISAGFPPRMHGQAKPLLGLADLWSRLKADLLARIRSHPLAQRAWEFVVSLRPVWWILRGWALSRLLVSLTGGGDSWAALPNTFLGYVVLGALLVLSIQWGRNKWTLLPWLRAVRTAASVVAVLLIPVFLGQVGSYLASANYSSDASSFDPPQGLQLNGSTVSNVFAYDANGLLITNVRFFDQDGNPLNAVGGEQRPDGLAYDPNLTPNPATPPFESVPPLAQN